MEKELLVWREALYLPLILKLIYFLFNELRYIEISQSLNCSSFLSFSSSPFFVMGQSEAQRSTAQHSSQSELCCSSVGNRQSTDSNRSICRVGSSSSTPTAHRRIYCRLAIYISRYSYYVTHTLLSVASFLPLVRISQIFPCNVPSFTAILIGLSCPHTFQKFTLCSRSSQRQHVDFHLTLPIWSISSSAFHFG